MNMKMDKNKIEKSNRKIDLSGFKIQDELNPKIWDKDQKMKSKVKKNLLKIADDYFESLDLPNVDIEDVTMTGSLANYNWSKYSDVDLHIVVDYDDIPVDEDLVQDFLKSKSSNWNKEHDVTIYGYDVELYVQDINEPHHSTGVYSILKDEWVTKPKKQKISFNDKSVKEKSNRLMDRVEEIYDEMDEVDNEVTIKRVEKLTDKIKKMRQSGLESGGEFSVENIVFKVLRRNGMLDRLYDIKTVAYDNSVTLESTNLDSLIESMLDDSFSWIEDELKNKKTPIEKYRSDSSRPTPEFDAENIIVMDFFRDKGVEKEGRWLYHQDYHSGAITWESPDLPEFIFYATPFWEGTEDTIHVDYQGDMGEYDTYDIIELPSFKFKEDLEDWLENEYPKVVSAVLEQAMSERDDFLEDLEEGSLSKKINLSEGSIKKKFDSFISNIKKEGGETKEAYKILVDSIKSGEKLTKKDKEKVIGQLKDILKLAGFTAASILPGGVLYIMLSRMGKFKKHMLPSSFLEESNDFDWVDDVKKSDSWLRVTMVLFNDNNSEPGYLTLRTFEDELYKGSDSNYWSGEQPTVIGEFDLLYPSFEGMGVSSGLGVESMIKTADKIVNDYHTKGIVPDKTYIWNSETKTFEGDS